LAFPPIPITAVEWPIQVYLILSLGQLKLGVLLIGSFLYSYYISSGIPLF